MKKIAIVFPGQGSQKVGMLRDYYARFSQVKKTFTDANDILGFNLWDIIQNNEKKLNQTKYTQPALLTASIAIWRVLDSRIKIMPQVFSGHSLGEYSALCAANSIDFSDALKLVHLRGKLMQSTVFRKKGAMSAILGLKPEEVIRCCNEANSIGTVEPANFNSHKQTVISGELNAVKKANEIAKKMGAKRTKILPVSAPSHCSLMIDASKEFSEALNKITIKIPKIKVIHNYDAHYRVKINDIKIALIKQLYSPVKWTQTIEKMKSMNVNCIIECGANSILSSLNKHIVKDIDCQNTATTEKMDNLTDYLKNKY